MAMFNEKKGRWTRIFREVCKSQELAEKGHPATLKGRKTAKCQLCIARLNNENN